MKKFLTQLAWCSLAGASTGVWSILLAVPTVWYDWLWVAPLSMIPFTGMVVGFRRGFPNGIWGIK
jgi:hypothetical protein